MALFELVWVLIVVPEKRPSLKLQLLKGISLLSCSLWWTTCMDLTKVMEAGRSQGVGPGYCR